MAVTGGHRIRAMLARAGRGGVKQVQIGFFSAARYSENQQPHVAQVATIHEFGGRHVPARPFFRPAVQDSRPKVRRLIRKGVDPTRMIVDRPLASAAATVIQNDIQRKIVDVVNPPLAPKTIERKQKKGKTSGLPPTPLIDTGYMRQSVTYKIG